MNARAGGKIERVGRTEYVGYDVMAGEIYTGLTIWMGTEG